MRKILPVGRRGFAPIFLLILISIVIGGIYYAVKPIYLTAPLEETNVTGCSLTGQSYNGSVVKTIETKFTNPTQPIDIYNGKTQKIIARVLSISPFVIEIYDRQIATSDFFDTMGIEEDIFVDTSEKDKLKQLKFNDLITADLYGFTYPSIELAFGNAINNIQKVETPNYFSASPNPFVNRSGTLIRYSSPDTNRNGVLLIFNNGKTFYRDNNSNIFFDKILTKFELNDLLKQFSKSDFDKIPADLETSFSDPSLVLVCSRYQKILLNNNITNLKPILTKLDKIIEDYHSNAKYIISYDRKRAIKEWEYASIVPLDQANSITFRQQNKERLSKIKEPDELKSGSDKTYTISNAYSSNYYRYNGKIYGIYFGACVDGTAGTWACFGAEELENRKSGGRHYELWPTELSINLGYIVVTGRDMITVSENSDCLLKPIE